MKIQFSAQVTKVETTADKGLRIKIVTPELKPNEKTTLFEYGDQPIWCAMADAPVEQMDVPDYVPDYKGQKSPSQRLKNVLYRLWEQKGGDFTDRQHYELHMEKLIDHFKAKLD